MPVNRLISEKKEKIKIALFVFIFAFSACTNRFSEVSIYSNLQEGDSISVALYSYAEDQYITVGEATVNTIDALHGKVDVVMPDSFILNTHVISFTFHCNSDSLLAISAILFKNYRKFYPQDILNNLWWQQGLTFEINPETNILESTVSKDIPGVLIFGFHHISRDISFAGLQYFYRHILLGVFLFLAFIICKQASSQRFLLFFIALFIASIPLIVSLMNFAMGFMLIAIFISFIYNKSRRFEWQPIFFAVCAVYLMNVIGLLYTVDFKSGAERLDRTVVMALFPIFFSMIQLSKNNVILLLRFYMWSIIALCICTLMTHVALLPEFTWNMVFRDSKQYAHLLTMSPVLHWHPSFLSIILLMAPPVALYLRYHNEKHITLIEMILGILTPVAFSFLVGARVGIVLSPILLVFGFLFYCKFKPELKWGLTAVGIVAAVVMLHRSPDVRHRFTDPIRIDLQRIAISAIKEKPIFGWGTGASRSLIISEERAHSLEIENPYDFHTFHNQYLDNIVYFGILGFLITIVLFGSMLWVGIREKHFLFLSLFIIFAIFCWVETPLCKTKGVVPFAFWFCFLISNLKNLTQIKKLFTLQDSK